MRGKGKYQIKIAQEKRRAIYWAILENQPITFMQLYQLLKKEGIVNSKRTLAKHLHWLIKAGKISKEPASLHLHHPNVLNPPLTMQSIILGRNINGKIVPDTSAPSKHVLFPSEPPKNPKLWLQKINRLILGNKKVYVVKLKA